MPDAKVPTPVVWAFIELDREGNEIGFLGAWISALGAFTPLATSSERNIPIMRQIAQRHAWRSGHGVHFVSFTRWELLETLTPEPGPSNKGGSGV